MKKALNLAEKAFQDNEIPVGAIIAATIYKNKTRVFLFLAGGVLFWSFLGSSIVGPITKLLAGM